MRIKSFEDLFLLMGFTTVDSDDDFPTIDPIAVTDEDIQISDVRSDIIRPMSHPPIEPSSLDV